MQNSSFFKNILFTCLFLGLIQVSLFAQHGSIQHHFEHIHPTLHSIEKAQMNGEISIDEAILEKLYAGFEPEKVSERFRYQNDRPIRCMTPVLQEFYRERDNLSAATVSAVENIINKPRSSAAHSYISPSGNFIFHYDLTGPNAVPAESTIEVGVPDYVYQAAFAADSSYRYQIEDLGFEDFVLDEPYEIFLENLGRLYGMTVQSGSTTFIRIHNNFQGFPENTHPESNEIGALYVTMAHEIKHASQFATNRWTCEPGRSDQAGCFNWAEMDATMMEEIVFDDVNDYYNYITDGRSIFSNPQNATPGAYWHVTWMLYFAEKHGMDFWVDVWDQFVDDRERAFLAATESALADRNSSLHSEHLLNHMWHMASGPDYSPVEFGFEERLEYPNPTFRNNFNTVPDSLINGQLSSYAANYIDVRPSNITLGQPNITLESSAEGIGIGVIGYFRDGSTKEQFFVDPNSTLQNIQTTWSWSELIDMSIAVVNTNRTQGGTYSLTLSSVLPEEDLLANNYPNPFNPTTQIEFSINRDKHIRLEVYDQIGRKVSTLIDEQLNRGFHQVTFDGTGLASGVYFYRIITDQTVTTNKMMLIK